MKKGAKPKPTALKRLEGNPGKRELNEYEPQMPIEYDMKPPRWLTKEAKKEWNRLAPTLAKIGILTLADTASFAAYCQAYSRWIQAEECIDKTGLVGINRETGKASVNPYVSVAKDALSVMKSFAAEFGLTPSVRTSIIAGIEAPKDKKSLDPMEQILTTSYADEGGAVNIGSNFADEEDDDG